MFLLRRGEEEKKEGGEIWLVGGGGCNHKLKISVWRRGGGDGEAEKIQVQNSLQCHFGSRDAESCHHVRSKTS